MQNNNAALDELIKSISGNSAVNLIPPDDSRYETARLVYNRMHDCYPKLIVQTMDVGVLRQVMVFAFKHNIVLAIRGGGHHIGGFGTCNDGILIDFSPFKNIRIDKENNIASVDPGVCLGDLDRMLTRHGYVVPTGTVSETGVAGLTLGGGIGWLIGQYGLTCDQLCGADVLLANGQLVQAEDPKHRDLLWALRGGGGNFGIVTTFRYRLNPLPKTVCGMGLVSWENVIAVMEDLVKYTENCPSSMTIAPVFTKDKQGNPQLRIDFCCANGTDEEISSLTCLSKYVEWLDIKEWDFAAWQCEFDHLFLPAMRGYWKAAYFETITQEIMQKLCDSFENSPLSRYSILIEHLHGSFKKYDQRTSAFPLRHCNFGILLAARWENQQDDQDNINWVRQSFDAIDPQETTATYLNYTSADDQRAIQSLLSSTQSKITQVKAVYDPNNYFKRNHNVLPK